MRLVDATRRPIANLCPIETAARWIRTAMLAEPEMRTDICLRDNGDI